MVYDIKINNTIRKGLSYAELITLPIVSETLVRRDSSDWIYAKDCVELTHILSMWNDMEVISNNSVEKNRNSLENENSASQTREYSSTFIAETDSPTTFLNRSPEERIFIPTAEYFKCKQKYKAAIIGICTLGLAGLSLVGIGNTWRSNIFEGTSFSSNAGLGFILKCLSFLFLVVLFAIPYFIYSIFAFIYYSIKMNQLKS